MLQKFFPFQLFLFSVLLNTAWAQPIAQHVIVVSIDGGSPTFIKQSQMPTLQNLAQEGFASWNAKTITPSITLPSHTSMLTGVGPETHQILWNDYLPEKGVVQVPTVFEVAKNHGFTTAFFATKDKFNHLHRPNSVDKFEIIETGAEKIAQAAGQYFESHKPSLTFVHFRDADRAGHTFGWGSYMQKRALEKVDGGLRILKNSVVKAGLSGQTILIVTADHGGTGFNHDENTPQNRTIPWIAWGAHVKTSQSQQEIATESTAATVLHILDIPEQSNWKGKPVKEAFVLE